MKTNTTKGDARVAQLPTTLPFRWSILNSRSGGLLAALGLASLIPGSLCAAGLNGPPLDPTRTQYALKINAPVIDGEINVLDPDEWRFGGGNSDYWHVFPDAAGFAADGVRGGLMGYGTVPANPEDLSFKVYAGFDAQHLYIAVRIKDSAIKTDSAAADSANSETWEDDSVEVFIDGGNANNANWAAGQSGGQFVITANNAYRDAEAGNPGYGPNAAWYAKAGLNANSDGYDAEFRISLATLGNPKPGDVVGFTVAVNDDDDGAGADRQMIWIGKAHRPAGYGNLILGAQRYSAPKVTIAPNPDGKINPTEYSIASEIRVNAMTGVVYIPGGDDDLPVSDIEYKAYVVHDNDAVYIAVDVTDDKISTDQSDVSQVPDLPTWEDDSVEIFFDLDNSKAFGGGTALAPGVFEGQYTQTHKGFYYDGSPSKEAQKGVHWFGSGSLTSTGYQVEFKILKSSLGNPQENTPIGFHVAVNDDDGVGDYSHVGWTGQAHHEYTYGTLTLAGLGGPVTPLRIVEIKPDLAAGNITLRWEGDGALFQVERAAVVTGPFQSVGTPQPQKVFTDAGALKTNGQSFYRIRQVAP